MSEDITTVWGAAIALLVALLGYQLTNLPGPWRKCRWFGVASVVLLFFMACEQSSVGTVKKSAPIYPPGLADMDQVTGKYFEGLWLLMKQRKHHDSYTNSGISAAP